MQNEQHDHNSNKTAPRAVIPEKTIFGVFRKLTVSNLGDIPEQIITWEENESAAKDLANRLGSRYFVRAVNNKTFAPV